MRGEGVDACGAGSTGPAARGIPSVGGYYGARVSRQIKARSAPELEWGSREIVARIESLGDKASAKEEALGKIREAPGV